ncbi:MAG: hypothetical protein BA868_02035 [Desulfobacterales bacterium C00003106]|jgi:type IV secretion system protein VirB2|nr:MAG: hypothetical protein BA868_02035 [Desulfobacterales bacterium C00003106]
MPWESSFDMILNSLKGPTARIIIIVSICLCGGFLAIGETGGIFKKVLMVVLGGSIMAGAVSIAGALFGV